MLLLIASVVSLIVVPSRASLVGVTFRVVSTLLAIVSIALVLSLLTVVSVGLLISFGSRALDRLLLICFILGNVGLLVGISLLSVGLVSFLNWRCLLGRLFSDSSVLSAFLSSTSGLALALASSRARFSVGPLLLLLLRLLLVRGVSDLSRRLGLRSVLRDLLILCGEPRRASQWRAPLAGGTRGLSFLIMLSRLCQIFLFEGLEHSY